MDELSGIKSRAIRLLLFAILLLVVTPPVLAGQEYAVGACRVVPVLSGGMIEPVRAADAYLARYHGNEPRFKDFVFFDAKVTLLKAPKRGRLFTARSPLAVSNSWYEYQALDQWKYRGRDSFVMRVEKRGISVKIHYTVLIVDGFDEEDQKACKSEFWKISAH